MKSIADDPTQWESPPDAVSSASGGHAANVYDMNVDGMMINVRQLLSHYRMLRSEIDDIREYAHASYQQQPVSQVRTIEVECNRVLNTYKKYGASA